MINHARKLSRRLRFSSNSYDVKQLSRSSVLSLPEHRSFPTEWRLIEAAFFIVNTLFQSFFSEASEAWKTRIFDRNNPLTLKSWTPKKQCFRRRAAYMSRPTPRQHLISIFFPEASEAWKIRIFDRNNSLTLKSWTPKKQCFRRRAAYMGHPTPRQHPFSVFLKRIALSCISLN